MWTGAILAGGRARRLGGLKKAGLVLHPRGESILDRQLTRLRRVVDRVVIVSSDSEGLGDHGVPVIPDLAPGALGGLYTAVCEARSERALVVACDMPFISESLLAHLVRVGQSVDIAIPRPARGYEPLCATYSPRCAPALRRLIDEQQFKLSEVAHLPGLEIREIGPAELEPFGPEEMLFFNVNTPDDYARAIDLDGDYHYPS